jgi:uncharacterized protein (UPF0332 family)
VTTPEKRREEFFEACVGGDDDPATGARRIDGSADRAREAERFEHQASYHLTGARELLGSDAELLVFKEGYYAMLHKANEAVAVAGFKPETHECTLLGLRGLYNAPDAADTLRRAKAERTNVDYGMNPAEPTLAEFNDPGTFLSEEVEPFFEAVDTLIAELDDS